MLSLDLLAALEVLSLSIATCLLIGQPRGVFDGGCPEAAVVLCKVQEWEFAKDKRRKGGVHQCQWADES